MARNTMRRRYAWCSFIAAVAAPVGAAGAESLPDLKWAAPESCPAEESVRRLVARWIVLSPEVLDIGSVQARARVYPEGRIWKLELRVDSPGGVSRETLSAERCEALAQAVALKMALAATPVESIQASTPPESAPAKPPPTPEPSETTFWGIRAAAGLTADAFPEAAGSVGVTGLVSVSGIRLELGAVYLFPQRVEYEDVPGVGATLELLGGALRGCPTATFRSVEIPICAGVEAGVLRASGFGAAENTVAHEPFLMALIGPALALSITEELKLWIEVDGMLGIVRPGYRMRNLPRLYRLEATAVQAWLGLECRFR